MHSMKLDIKIHIQVKNKYVTFIIIVEPTYFKCDVIHVIKRILYPYIISNVHCAKKTGEGKQCI